MLTGASRSLVVADAQADVHFAALATTHDLGVGAYSGVTLYHADGAIYGTLCTLHPQTRPALAGELDLLALAGRLIMQAVDREALRTAERQLLHDLDARAASLRRVADVSAAVAAQTDLPALLERIVQAAAQSAGLQSLSLLLLDAERGALTHAAAVGLPAAYLAALNGQIIGPAAGTCGTAAYRGEMVITEDLLTDLQWDDYRHLTLPYGLRAVWSVPLIGAAGRVLGTVAAYRERPGRPTDNQREALFLYARLAAVAVENAQARAREERLVQVAESQAAELRTIIDQIPDAVIVLDAVGQVRLLNKSGRWLIGPGASAQRPVPEYAAYYQLRDALTGEDLTPARTPLGRALAGETVESAELLMRRPDEQQDRLIRASAAPLRDADGRPRGAVSVFADVTGERALLRGLAASEEQLRTVYAALACGVVVLDAAGALLDANGAAQQILGLDLAGLRAVGIAGLRARVTTVQGAQPPPPAPGRLAVLQVQDLVRDMALGYTRPDGQQRQLLLDVAPILDDAGRVERMVLSFVDVTDRTRAEAALRESEQRMRVVVANAPIVLFALDSQGVFTLSEGQGLAAMGLRPGEVVGTSVFDHHEERPGIVAAVRRALAGEEHTTAFEVNGVVFETRYVPLRDAAGLVTGVIGLATDISERRRMEDELRRQALHDALTDLPNRVLLRDLLQRHAGVSSPDGRPLALCLLDLDRFKEINDTFGHHHGDLLLQQVATRLRQTVRPTDVVGRLGGDEFAVLLLDEAGPGALIVAAKIGAALALPYTIEGQTFHVAASIGVALAPEHGRDATTLLRRADVAMYAAKQSRQGFALYTPEQDAALPDRLALIGDLRQALAQDSLLLHYQPKVDLRTGRVISVEALTRWPHPQRGFVPPDQFIPLAEGAGLIGSFTDWVLNTALAQCRHWRDAGLVLDVAVNISVVTLHDPQLPDTIAGLLRAHDLPAARLRLEVTESTLMADATRAHEVLTGLAALGVGLSVDDFGTGYSSLARLTRLPVDELKIDRSFIRHLTTDQGDQAIVSSTIGLSHTLNLRVVAEGVEDQATWDALLALGCDSIQGYYLSRPLPAVDLVAWLRGCPFDGAGYLATPVGAALVSAQVLHKAR